MQLGDGFTAFREFVSSIEAVGLRLRASEPTAKSGGTTYKSKSDMGSKKSGNPNP